VVKYPVPVLVVSLGLIMAAGIPFLHVRFASPSVDTLPSFFVSRQVTDTINADFANDDDPSIDILLTLPVDPTSTDGIRLIQDYVAKLKLQRGVSSVDGITDVGAKLPPENIAFILLLSPDHRLSDLVKRYVNGKTTLISVNYDGDTNSTSTQNLLQRIKSVPIPNDSSVLIGGQTAELVDQINSIKSKLPLSITIIFVATFLVLLRMLSSIVIPLKAILVNTLSLSAAFGIMTSIFQYGHLHKLLHFTSCGSLDPTLPVLIFAIAFGLATDYEVFLVSRIKEEYERLGDNSQAVIIGIEKTGGIITAAGLLLVVVVAAFGMSDILSMKEMGVGLAVAVAVDAAIVRTLLVPAAMQVFDRLNWWLPWKK
jgi:RND superfamily putative drug exporter